MVCFPAQTGITICSQLKKTRKKNNNNNLTMCFTFYVPKKDANVNVRSSAHDMQEKNSRLNRVHDSLFRSLDLYFMHTIYYFFPSIC